MTSLLITNVRPFVDGELQPASQLLIKDGKLKFLSDVTESDLANIPTKDANGAWLIPAAIDLGAHLPEPGYPQKGNIASELQAASHGGISHVCSFPDTKPVADSSAVIQLMRDRAAVVKGAQLLPMGALTPGLAGEQIANMVTLRDAGACSLSNARQPVKSNYVMRRLMEYAATYDIPLTLTANDASLAANGCLHEGPVATKLGLPGIPETAETIALAQIMLLAEQTEVRVHISQLSCAASVQMIADASQRGIKVTADTALANLLYIDQHSNGYNSLFHVQPPLRSDQDRQALIAAVRDGLLAISSNHSPHELAAKKAPYEEAAAGMSVFDTFLPAALQLVHDGELSLEQLVQATSKVPGEIIGTNNRLANDQLVNAVLIDAEKCWTVITDTLLSQGKNNPLVGSSMTGQVMASWSNGELVFDRLS